MKPSELNQPIQLSLCFDRTEEGDMEEAQSCRDYVGSHCVKTLYDGAGKKIYQGTIAMKMDMSPSGLKRKLMQYEGDSPKFSVDDLETYIRVTGDLRPIYWLCQRYLPSQQEMERRKQEEELKQKDLELARKDAEIAELRKLRAAV